jgi:cytosine/adenosine deaminase-related metal-dependent hydrolase
MASPTIELKESNYAASEQGHALVSRPLRAPELQRADRLPPKNRVTDGSGCYLTPGLLNAQSHATMMQLGSVAQDIIVEYLFNKHICMYEKNLTPHDSYACTLLGEAECAQRLTRPATAQPLHTR